MALLFLVYAASGFPIGSIMFAKRRPPLGLTDWLGVLAFHGPALLITLLGIWQARRTGKFFKMDTRLFVTFMVIAYGCGLGAGYYMEH